jgi:hypothetical protein
MLCQHGAFDILAVFAAVAFAGDTFVKGASCFRSDTVLTLLESEKECPLPYSAAF